MNPIPSSSLKSDCNIENSTSVAKNNAPESSIVNSDKLDRENLVRQKVEHWWSKKLPKEPIKGSFESLEHANFDSRDSGMLLLDQPGVLGGPTGVAFQVVVICLIFSQYGIYVNFVLLPMGLTSWSLVHMIVSGTSVSLLLYSYYKSCLTNPGEVPSEWKPTTTDPLADSTSQEEGWRYCTKCSNYKPPRAHHCRACNRCILRMDHHCPWINNCVGFYNHKYFMLFLIYVAFTSAYCLSMGLIRLVELLQREETSQDPWATVALIMLLTLTGPLGLGVCVLLVWQLWLLYNNCTTIEVTAYQQYQKDAAKLRRNFYWPYDLGKINNIKALMGSSVGLWFVPATPKDIGDGLSFPLNEHYSEMMNRATAKRAASAPALVITTSSSSDSASNTSSSLTGPSTK
eukprot:TRINITY_DN6364_c0_g1_i1.p1 TRINITY_DN6364_c0_g1~~TRINITY_DN6364_c0_g1_i1.p1  ORF type:complete len:401 (-),score=19.19 TRINITY_DN6364_c0_g1_i1:157-1359(-)